MENTKKHKPSMAYKLHTKSMMVAASGQIDITKGTKLTIRCAQRSWKSLFVSPF